MIGVGAGFKAELNLLALMGKRGTVRASTLRARPLEEKAAAMRAVEKEVLPLFERGRARRAGGGDLPARGGGGRPTTASPRAASSARSCSRWARPAVASSSSEQRRLHLVRARPGDPVRWRSSCLPRPSRPGAGGPAAARPASPQRSRVHRPLKARASRAPSRSACRSRATRPSRAPTARRAGSPRVSAGSVQASRNARVPVFSSSSGILPRPPSGRRSHATISLLHLLVHRTEEVPLVGEVVVQRTAGDPRPRPRSPRCPRRRSRAR